VITWAGAGVLKVDFDLIKNHRPVKMNEHVDETANWPLRGIRSVQYHSGADR
jgi:hypothetical protein